MGLESATYLNDLVSTNPTGSDGKSEGDDHIRLVKAVLQATLPGMAGRAWRKQAKSADYTAVATDNMSWLNFTGNATLSLPAAATAGNGFCLVVRPNSGLTVTIDPNGSELINTAATISIADEDIAVLFCDGAAWIAAIVQPAGKTELTAPTLIRPAVSSPRETYSAPGGVSGAVTVDMAGHSVFAYNLTGNITSLTISNIPPGGYMAALTFILTQAGSGGYTVAWPGTVKWPGGVAPTLTATVGKLDIITLVTIDAGGSWYGLVPGQNF